jgi:RES domain
MIAFRQVDARYPFLWEDASQPAARWHGEGEGPVHYFANTPDGAWAEFLRHEEIDDPADLKTIRRQMWAVDIGNLPTERVDLPRDVLTGGPETYTRCREHARALRARGVRRLAAISAALTPGGARGLCVRGGVQPGDPLDGVVVAIFGPPDDLLGWIAAVDGRPPDDLLPRVHHLQPRTEVPDGTPRRISDRTRHRVVRRPSSPRRAASSSAARSAR